MILRKPYIMFIKLFKPMHIFMAILMSYLIYNTNKILTFLSNYIHSETNVVGESIKSTLVDNSLFVVPSILIIICLIFLGIMFNKKKSVSFYVINIFAFLVIIIINLYDSSFLTMMEENIVSIKIVKLNHDLIFINMIIEIVSFISLLVRGLGINFKNFNFDSDISNLNISESDREEIEVNINIDFDDNKRKRNKKLRHLKYLYIENKTIINIVGVIIVALISFLFCYIFIFSNKENTEGSIYNLGGFNLKINRTLFLKEDFNGKKITNDYLVIAEVSMQSMVNGKSLYLADFSLNVGNAIYKPITKYNNRIMDIGTAYNEDVLTNEYTNYLLVFEIPTKYIESDLFLIYSDEGYVNKFKLNPVNFTSKEIKVSKKIGETISFEELLGDINFNITNYEIRDKFLIEYNYNVKKDEYFSSKEYLKPSIDQNFDKYLMMLEVKFSNNGKLNINSFYDFFSKFGSIYYKKQDKWYTQNSFFEEVKSKKVESKNKVYIGINSEISNATSIKLVFNIRDSRYEYILK